jgi:hypothetical protein
VTETGKTDLPGVRYMSCSSSLNDINLLKEKKRILLETGVRFKDTDPTSVPWLVGDLPFALKPELRQRLQQLGEATFKFIDVVQQLYRESEPIVHHLLDINVPPSLCGQQLDRYIETFRLDIILEQGFPKVTEIEEIYGNVGKMYAMQQAYNVDFSTLFGYFTQSGLTHIFVDDTIPHYLPELTLLQQCLKKVYNHHVDILYFSQFPERFKQTAWRFCYTKDLIQYSSELRKRILEADGFLFNPLFHGYGTKAMIALAFHPQLSHKLRAYLGEDYYNTIQNGFAFSSVLDSDFDPDFHKHIISQYKRYVLKVIDCPGGPHYTWGSRGVFFGERSATRWRAILDAAFARQIPGTTLYQNVRYMISELVESDRFSVKFLHPQRDTVALMDQARIRLGPIFFRRNGVVNLAAGHATFVNTSRKVHLGHHAVCSPILF